MVYRHIESVVRVTVYRHIDCDPPVMVYRNIESVFELWFTDILIVFLSCGLQTY